ncbi:DNA replication/repair protein RecF [Croceibacterium sp. TMG7-5b_MA50]|uniref:DNA replication/repair protein RecF n=1 Tax=Croceibacterium sp. TMG7-5b_MA50 TaxID=3121290 RepID=UPI0032216AC6
MLDRVALRSFRNHRDTMLVGARRLNLLVGENGAGKTNVLEAVSLLAPGRGLRRAALPEMAAEGTGGGFAISARLAQADADPVQLGTGTSPDQPGRRLVQVNGATASAAQLGEWLAIAWLTPAMDRLFADSAGARRRYMDRLALALQPGHATLAARHERALRERNRLLSAEAMPEARWLDAVEAQLAETGAALANARAMLVERLAAALATMPNAPFARPTLAYRPGGPLTAEALVAELARGRARDRAAQRTLVGPQRDDLQVTHSAKAMPAALSSTGEQKAMLIALTLAHAGLLSGGSAGDRPGVLLLDEVAAHLDPMRRDALFDLLRDFAGQVWLTGTEASPFAGIMSDAAGWQVTAGAATPL